MLSKRKFILVVTARQDQTEPVQRAKNVPIYADFMNNDIFQVPGTYLQSLPENWVTTGIILKERTE